MNSKTPTMRWLLLDAATREPCMAFDTREEARYYARLSQGYVQDTQNLSARPEHMRNLLPDDVSRCNGTDDAQCVACWRRLQMDRDARQGADHWFPHVAIVPAGPCAYRIGDDL